MSARPKKSIVCVIGTRPEAIKMAPVIRALSAQPWARCRVLLTGQHRELADQVLNDFGIEPDVDLAVMRLQLPVTRLASHLVASVSEALTRLRPELVMAQGDTTSALATALACAAQKLPLAHVEAGLRSHELYSPYPEEANRIVVSHLAALHFAPTRGARENLLREGIDAATIHVTGNTVIDALQIALNRSAPIGVELDWRKRLVLVTAHRRESFGAPLRGICRAIQELHELFPHVEFLWPVHPNPAVKPVVMGLLGSLARVRLCEPLGYGPFVTALARSALVLTDSGGVQEEAPALGKPVLVMRNESERPEAIEAGVAKLVGQDPRSIVTGTSRLLSDPSLYRRMSRGASPYGDGRAAERIVAIVGRILEAAQPVRAAV